MACCMCIVEVCDEEAEASIVTRRGGCAWWSTGGGDGGGGGQKGGRARMRLGAKRRVMLLAPEVEMTGRRSLFTPFVLASWGACAKGRLSPDLHSIGAPVQRKQATCKRQSHPPSSSSSSTQFHRQALTTIHPFIHAHTPSLRAQRHHAWNCHAASKKTSVQIAVHLQSTAPEPCPFLTRQPQPLDFVPAWGPCAGSSCHRRYRCSLPSSH